MVEKPKYKPVRDRNLYAENRKKYGPEELRPYEGHWAAWYVDGSCIVAFDEDIGLIFGEAGHSRSP